MADDVTGAPTGAEARAAIDAAFNDAPEANADAVEGAGASPTEPTPALPVSGAPEGRPEWVPENFWTAGTDGAGQVNTEAMAKSWNDTRAALTRAQQQVTELSKPREAVPLTPDEYWEGMDYTRLSERAPAAYAGGEGENPAVKAMLTALHKGGIPPAEARQVTADYFELIDKGMERPKTQAEARKEAVASLGPNGPRVAADVKAWLGDLAQAGAFGTKEEMEFITASATHGPALLALDAVRRASMKGGGPPSLNGAAAIKPDPKAEEEELYKLLGDPDAWDQRQHEIRRRFANLETIPEYAQQG